jgi:hypothetical protein
VDRRVVDRVALESAPLGEEGGREHDADEDR